MALILAEALRLQRNSSATRAGYGVSYPIQRSDTGGFSLAQGEELIRQAVLSLVETGIYERPFQVRNGVPYGTRIPYLLFENVSDVFDIIQFDVDRAIRTWEPRVTLMYVVPVASDLGGDPRSVRAHVRYKIKATGEDDGVQARLRRIQ